MKRYYWTILAAAIALTAIAGCDEGGDDGDEIAAWKKAPFAYDTTTIATDTLPDAEKGARKLSYTFKKGENFTYRYTSSARETQTIKAPDTTMTQTGAETRVYVIKTTIQEVESDGTFEAELEVLMAKVEAVLNDETVSYVSTEVDSAEREEYWEYEALLNKPFNVRVRPDGDLVDFFRADRIVNDMIERSGLKDSLSVEQLEMFRMDIMENVIRPMASQIFRGLPEEEVGVDSAWTIPQPPIDLQILRMKPTHTFALEDFVKKGDDVVARIEGSLENETTVSDMARQSGISVEDPVVTGGGSLFFNVSKGRYEKSVTRTSIELEFSAPIPTRGGGVARMTRTQSSTTLSVLELLEANASGEEEAK
jgi:hypothetical protein